MFKEWPEWPIKGFYWMLEGIYISAQVCMDLSCEEAERGKGFSQQKQRCESEAEVVERG